MIFAESTAAAARPQNNLLRALRPVDYALIASALEAADYPARHLLYNPGDHVGTVYFPCGPSLVSYVVASEDGREVETMLVGREGAVGGVVSRGNLPAFTRMVVQFAGPFMHLRLDVLEAAKERSTTLSGMFARYADCMLAQMMQAAACNATHSIEQRTAKWIVSALERTGDTAVPLTQEQLAAMLGVGRSYASRVIQSLRREGLLQTRRGALLVTNRSALEAKSCLCNEQVKGHFEAVLSGVYPTESEGNGAAAAGSVTAR
ncbi:Crp/Fnr family transcriptional regulator [Bradyrhizobium sp. LHD-71]|uniref:Crp/Fnr family transcriptional regulator n=1 Tax=Bradyrhizobium sp. LHD-71 TaxID=3072141 RepID=UPI00280CC42B|nr:Crp/Fnr family transcriptional regulator [Bradyrhizobium sp. LHD-71]MDQ8729605.1 Crp/Fnr family transcriptional regulator [Bradyrhizobium sp. LHD-71]